jgi:hypothetical protein
MIHILRDRYSPMTSFPSPLVHILVLNYCSLDDTLACVETIHGINYPNFHLRVIDNLSPDGSGKELAQVLPAQEFMQMGKNLGYAGGNNYAIRRALQEGADYVLIVNPDVRLPPDCLRDYVDIMSRDQSIAGLNAIQLQGNGIEIDRGFRVGVLQPNGLDQESFDASEFPDTFESPVLYGAALMLSAAAIRQVGGFDPLYFAYHEEIDLCRRLRLHGYRLIVTSRSPVLHIRTQYAKPLSRRVRFLRLKGYYLSRLKNQEREMRATLKAIFREIRAALLGRAGNIYPYDTYPYDRSIVLQTLGWLVWFLPLIWLHKKHEARNGMHYI